jgi:hypothetical protein
MDSWKIYGLTVVALFVKMVAMVLVQGYGRYKHRGFANPEDAVMFDKLFGHQPDAFQLGLWVMVAMSGQIVWRSLLSSRLG